MVVYGVKNDKWPFKLAPQLVGKAQQAYAGLSVSDASDYDQLKPKFYGSMTKQRRVISASEQQRPGESN